MSEVKQSDSNEQTKTKDYLEVDSAIPGQNYVCLSFLSPESLIQNKETFKCAKFLQSYCKDQKLKFEEVYKKYQDFCYKYEDKLQRDFDEQNDFQTSLRGIKVRGVFDTRAAAEDRAKSLSNLDSSFHVFIGQVGYWLPWDPNADKVAEEHFQNTQLNEMMQKYQENNVNRDIFYEEQKREKVKAAREEALKKKREEQEQKALEKIEDGAEKTVEAVEDAVKTVEDAVEEVKSDAQDATEGVEEVVEGSKETVSEVHKIEEDLKESLEGVDPWLASKLQQKEVEPEPEPTIESTEPEPEECTA